MEVIYLIAFLLIFLTASELVMIKHKPTSSQKHLWSIIWLIFSLIVFASAATRVGGSDWENYETIFNIVTNAESLSMAIISNGLLEPGYVLLNYIVSELGGTRRDLIVIEAGITSAATYLVLTKVRGGSIIMSWLMTLTFIGLMPVRQTVALAIVMIVFSVKSRPLQVVSSMVAPTIHISAILLLIAKFFGGKSLTKPMMIRMIFFVVVAMYALNALLVEKIGLYRDASSELTDLSTSSVVIGKLITLLFVASLWYYASKRSQVQTCPSVLSYTILHIMTMLSLTLALVNPAFARLTSLFEIIYIWNAAQNIYYLNDRKLRLILYSAISVVIIMKIIKTLTQFAHVYDVCFFCAGVS